METAVKQKEKKIKELNKFKEYKKQAQELKGNYLFKSPFHNFKKMLPFKILGTISFDDDFIKFMDWTGNSYEFIELY